MRLAYKIWLDNDGKAFGEGPYELLKYVEETGSLHQAALKMAMSYRKAWLTIQASEKRLGFQLLARTVGGPSGGGSLLTPSGRRFMRKYERFRREVSAALTRVFDKHFTDPSKSSRS